MGYLTGTINQDTTFTPGVDLRSGFPRFTPQALTENQPFVDLLRRVGGRLGASPAQVALAWLLAQKPWIVPIPGTTSPAHLDEDMGATSVQLPPDVLRELDQARSTLKVSGARSSEALMAGIDSGAKLGTRSLTDDQIASLAGTREP